MKRNEYINEAKKCEKEQDYAHAMYLLELAEKENNPEALYQIGRFYLLGYGVERSYELAKDYLVDAAEMGHVKANFVLYKLLDRDKPEIAVGYLRYAAGQGHPEAMYDLAIHLLYGESMPEDVPEAVRLLRKCAEMGNEAAVSKLRFLEKTGYRAE